MVDRLLFSDMFMTFNLCVSDTKHDTRGRHALGPGDAVGICLSLWWDDDQASSGSSFRSQTLSSCRNVRYCHSEYSIRIVSTCSFHQSASYNVEMRRHVRGDDRTMFHLHLRIVDAMEMFWSLLTAHAVIRFQWIILSNVSLLQNWEPPNGSKCIV